MSTMIHIHPQFSSQLDRPTVLNGALLGVLLNIGYGMRNIVTVLVMSAWERFMALFG
jgi:hypothetical protein